MNIENTILQTFYAIKRHPPEFVVEEGTLPIMVFVEGHCIAGKECSELIRNNPVDVPRFNLHGFQKISHFNQGFYFDYIVKVTWQ